MSGFRKDTQEAFNKLWNEGGAVKIPNLPNPVKHIGNNISIIYMLYKGELHECLINTDDIKKVSNGYTWVAHGRKDRKTLYARCLLDTMHRLIIKVNDNEVIDHIDGNGLNNTKGNLRSITQAENMLNKRKYKNNKTGAINIQHRGNYYYFNTQRRFVNKDVAAAAATEVNKILDAYAMKDIRERPL